MNNSQHNKYNLYIIFLLILFWRQPYSVTIYAVESITKPKSPDLFLVSESPEWLIATTIPILKKCSGNDPLPYLLVYDPENAEESRTWVLRLGIKKAVQIITADKNALSGLPQNIAEDVRAFGSDPTEAGLRIIETFWGQSQAVIMAYIHDTGAMVLGSSLAAHRVIPLIPVAHRNRAVGLNKNLVRLGVRKIYLAVTEGKTIPVWMKDMQQEIEVLDKTALTKSLVEQINPEKIRNVVLARTPVVGLPNLGKSSWLAGYYSLLRHSPILLCDDSDGSLAEEGLYTFWDDFSLQPRTLTILADFQSIYTIAVQDASVLGEYEVCVEPCARPLEKQACPLGVGRIPFADLPVASLMMAQTIRHERQWRNQSARILMIANPSADYGPLPLAETASRATAEEFKNCYLHIDEFYGVPAHDPNVRTAAEEAHLIIFEGHVTDQTLLQDPEYYPDDVYVAEGNEYEHADFAEQDYETVEDPTELDSSYPSGQCIPLQGNSLEIETDEVKAMRERFSMDLPQIWQSAKDYFNHFAPKPSLKCVQELRGMPLVILQSCHSLEETVTRQFLQRGGAGVIGSVTNMHSASGSSFIKSLCDSMLYQGTTAGEALRDARNYYLCWRDLKAKRGHTQLTKVHRAALSFCLWGDPELRVFPNSLPKPKRKAIASRWKDPNTIQITTPKRHLPVVQTAKYQACIFPSSQIAGVVKRLKDKEYRRLMPLYFFRLAIPPNFEVSQNMELIHRGHPSDRVVFLTDPAQRWIYVLYFPEKEEKGDTIEFELVHSPASKEAVERADFLEYSRRADLSGAGTH
jgi:hypothetical protein